MEFKDKYFDGDTTTISVITGRMPEIRRFWNRRDFKNYK